MNAEMSIDERDDGWIEYRSHRTDDRAAAADFVARYRPVSEPSHAAPGTIEHWLSARYCLYAVDSSGSVYRAEIHHRPWPLQDAEAELTVNTMAEAAGIPLTPQPQLLSFARQLDVVVWFPERCRSEEKDG
jgi:uncharacterized protein YqjF (DUF2071 family)